MKRYSSLLVLLVLVFLTACDAGPQSAGRPEHAQINQRWSGDYPVAELHRLPVGQQGSRIGYLTTPMAFETVWQIFRSDEALPPVNFDTHLVVFLRNVDFYNRINIAEARLQDGVMELLAMETMSAIRITDKVAMAMIVVPRTGIKLIRSGPASIPFVEQ